MPKTKLKPTTPEERERWKTTLTTLLRNMPLAAATARDDREFCLRLIDDVERLKVREAELEGALLAVEACIEEHRKRCPLTLPCGALDAKED